MGKSTASTLQNSIKSVISSVGRRYRYVVVEDRIGHSNFVLPYSQNRYGKDRIVLNCSDGRVIRSDIILTGSYDFVLVKPHSGYCFAKVTANSIQIGGDRLSLPK